MAKKKTKKASSGSYGKLFESNKNLVWLLLLLLVVVWFFFMAYNSFAVTP